MLQPLQKTICWLNILVLFDPAKALWSIYTKNLKTYPHRNLHVNNYSWNQPRCLSVREWSTPRQLNIKVQKRNELSMHKKTWRNLKRILLSAKSQSEMSSYCRCLVTQSRPTLCNPMGCNPSPPKLHSGKGKTLETVNDQVVKSKMEGVNWQSTEDFWSIEYILYDPIIMDACHFHLSKSTQFLRVNPMFTGYCVIML